MLLEDDDGPVPSGRRVVLMAPSLPVGLPYNWPYNLLVNLLVNLPLNLLYNLPRDVAEPVFDVRVKGVRRRRLLPWDTPRWSVMQEV